MAFTNTVSQTVFTTRRVIEHGFRRARIPAQLLTAEYVDIAKDQLYLLLSSLANEAVPLWCVDKVLMPLYDGVEAVTLPLGVVDVLNGNHRTLTALSGDITDDATSRVIDFQTAVAPTTVGIKWTMTSPGVTFSRSDDRVNWTDIQSETPQAYSDEWTWFDLANVREARYFRIQVASGTFGFSQIVVGNNPSEVPLARLSRDQYAALSNKSFKSNRPLQYWFDRQVRYPVMHMWPMPNSSAEQSMLVLEVHRHIMDVGSLTQEIEVPQRWYEAIVAQLACRLCREIVEADLNNAPLLDAEADRLTRKAWDEERDRSPIQWLPDIAMYTR